MNMTRDEHRAWTDRLSEYLDGGLSEESFAEVEAHLSACGSCRRVLEELRSVVGRAGALGGIEPPRDLWGGIAATIQAPAPRVDEGAKVIALPTAEERAHTVGPVVERRLSFTAPQLAAAAVTLIVASSIGTWAAGPGLGARGDASDVGVTTPSAFVMASANDADAPEGLAAELRTLEEAMVAARSELDPNTVRVLERNLGVIEKAIEDSRQALALDPGNEFLSQHLERVYQRKLAYLREATQVVEWSS